MSIQSGRILYYLTRPHGHFHTAWSSFQILPRPIIQYQLVPRRPTTLWKNHLCKRETPSRSGRATYR